MFMLWAIPAGIAIGFLAGGHMEGLSRLRIRWPWLAVGGLLVQVALFTPSGELLAGAAVPALYVGSTLAVFAAVLRNVALPGMPLVALGSVSNLLAIVANGGAMPADPSALEAAGFLGPGEHTNSVVLDEPALRPLTDIFAIPAGMPLANVFSVGDVLIALGLAWLIAATMCRGPVEPAPPAERASAAR